MENLGELCNYQYTVILCEIFELCTTHLNKIFKLNPRKYNSDSSYGRRVHQNKSKCIIALPTNAETVKLCEKTLIGGFSGVNTRITFDSQMLPPKNQRDNLKLIYKFKTGRDCQNKRISIKTLKMYENN